MDESNLSIDARRLGEGAKSSCKRFVDNSTQTEREAFVESGDIEDLYQENGQIPSPQPTATHIEYMQEYIRQEYI